MPPCQSSEGARGALGYRGRGPRRDTAVPFDAVAAGLCPAWAQGSRDGWEIGLGLDVDVLEELRRQAREATEGEGQNVDRTPGVEKGRQG